MAIKVRNTLNSNLLYVDYSKRGTIKRLLQNWKGLEAMSMRGDRVATCVLADLKTVTGIDLDSYDPVNRESFNRGYEGGVLSYAQYMGVVYTMVLGYSQKDVAFMMGVDQSVVARNTARGVARICKALTHIKGAYEDDEE